MRVYLIAAPEDQAEAEKLAEYLKRFGVFIRTEFGQMAYPPAQYGEFTLALWSRNSMMSSRQMMLTNRAIDAWEEGRLIMARLEHGLNPRGLSDLEMVDLTFAAAREHRYHDVLNAIRAMEDQHRRMRQEAVAVADAPPGGPEGAGGLSARASEDQSEMLASAPPPDAPVLSAPQKAASAPTAKSSGSARLVLILLGLMLAVGLGYVGLQFTNTRIDQSPPQPTISDPDMPGGLSPVTRAGDIDVEAATPEDLTRLRRSIAALESQISRERLQLMELPSSTEEERDVVAAKRARIAELRDDVSEQMRVEEALSFRFEAASSPDGSEVPVNPPQPVAEERRTANAQSTLSGPLLWGGLAAGLGLIALILFGALRRKPKAAAKNASAPAPEPASTPKPAPVAAVLDGHDAFVSYSHQNAETVLPIVESIEESGISVWIDRDELRGGQNWAGQIVRAIKSADRFCLMCSAQAFESDHVRREVYLADKYGKTMVPIRLDESEMPEDIEYFLIGRQWVDVFEMDESDRSKAIKAILSNLVN